MTPQMWADHVDYLRAAITHRKDPRAPEPDLRKLTGPHGPFRSVSIGTDPANGKACVVFEVQNEIYKPRYAPPEAFLVLRLLLAFGGGCSINGTNSGLSYVRVFGGDRKQMLGRILLDTEPGAVTRQDPRADYHNNDPAVFSKTPAEEVAGGRPMRSPHKGRQDATETAMDYFYANVRKAGIKITEAEYRKVLEEAFWLLDKSVGISAEKKYA